MDKETQLEPKKADAVAPAAVAGEPASGGGVVDITKNGWLVDWLIDSSPTPVLYIYSASKAFN